MKSYCVILKKNVLERKKECSRIAYEVNLNKDAKSNANGKKSNSNSNGFNALDSDSDDEKDVVVVEDFPALCVGSSFKNVSIDAASSYASMVNASMVCAKMCAKVDCVKPKENAKVLSWVEMNEIDSDDDDE